MDVFPVWCFCLVAKPPLDVKEQRIKCLRQQNDEDDDNDEDDYVKNDDAIME